MPRSTDGAPVRAPRHRTIVARLQGEAPDHRAPGAGIRAPMPPMIARAARVAGTP